jgi:uncharacterized protein DUF5666/BACON domain-containing protein/all-beta uncharacterized protein
MSRDGVTLPLIGLVLGIVLTAACGSTTETIVNTTGPSSTRCQPTLGSPSASYGAGGGTGSLTVAVERECEWTANPSAGWIVVTAGKQGQGDGTVAYRVTENADPLSRRGSIEVAGQTAQIAQEAAPCQFTVAPGELSASSIGGDLSIDVRTHSACTWTAAGGTSWVSISPSSGKGDGAVQVHVGANTSGSRSTALTVAGQRVMLSQQGGADPTPPPGPPGPNPPGPPPPQCSYALSSSSASFDGDGGAGNVRIRTSAPCPWTVVSSAAWLTVTGASSGSGDAEVRFLVAPNFSMLGRSATLTIQSEVFRVTQGRAEELKLEGKISNLAGACPNLRFRVDNRTVVTDRETEFRHGECTKARNGDGVTVRGFAQPDATVVATRIDF